METFLIDNKNEIIMLWLYFLIVIFVIIILDIFRDFLCIISEKSLREFEILHNKKTEDIKKQLKNIEDKVGLIIKENKLEDEYDIDINEVFKKIEQIERNRDKRLELEKEEPPIFDQTSFEMKNYEPDYSEYLKKEKERLEKILCNDTFSFEDYSHFDREQKEKLPTREGYYRITELCGVEMGHLDNYTNYAICKGVRKTNETIKLTKKNLKTDEIILEHEFDIYETSDKHIYKKFIVYHSLCDDNKRIRFFEKQKEGYYNVEIDDRGKPYVLTILQNHYGNISVIRNHKYY